jgi:hypothetical protein
MYSRSSRCTCAATVSPRSSVCATKVSSSSRTTLCRMLLSGRRGRYGSLAADHPNPPCGTGRATVSRDTVRQAWQRPRPPAHPHGHGTSPRHPPGAHGATLANRHPWLVKGRVRQGTEGVTCQAPTRSEAQSCLAFSENPECTQSAMLVQASSSRQPLENRQHEGPSQAVDAARDGRFQGPDLSGDA